MPRPTSSGKLVDTIANHIVSAARASAASGAVDMAVRSGAVETARMLASGAVDTIATLALAGTTAARKAAVGAEPSASVDLATRAATTAIAAHPAAAMLASGAIDMLARSAASSVID